MRNDETSFVTIFPWDDKNPKQKKQNGVQNSKRTMLQAATANLQWQVYTQLPAGIHI